RHDVEHHPRLLGHVHSPLPLAGRGWGWGCQECQPLVRGPTPPARLPARRPPRPGEGKWQGEVALMTWGIIPAAGRGTRIQPLAFSKELLPVGSRASAGGERPCAVSEYLLDRMLRAGADRICFVISPGKW